MYLKRFKFIIELVKISEVYCVTVMHWILKENCKSHLNLCRFYLVANYAEFGFCESHLHREYSPEKWLHNTPVTGPNKSKKLTRLIALVHNIRGKVWRKNNIHGFTDKLLSVKPCRPMVLFIPTLPCILCAGAISHVSFYRICLDRLLGLCNRFSGEYKYSIWKEGVQNLYDVTYPS